MSELELLQRRFERERAARHEAESLLEHKSKELYQSNSQLASLAEELREQAERSRAIFESAAEGIITYDQNGVIDSFNRSACRIFECDAAIGHDVRDFFDSQSLPSTAFFPLENGDLKSFELSGVRPCESTFLVEVAVSRTKVGSAIVFAAVVRDLTRRRELEARLNQAQKMESVGQLAAGIAHEINTPIQFIGDNINFLQGAFEDLGALIDLFQGLVDAVGAGQPTDHLMQEIAEQSEIADLSFLREEFPGAIRQSLDGIERVAKIVRAMKDFSQPASESKTSVNINHAIENMLTIAACKFQETGSIELALDPNLKPTVMLAGPFNQALLNIFTNAVEAIAEHRPEGNGKILISTRVVNDAVEVRFEDNGPGIPAEFQDRIFDPFFTTKEVGKGTGQGLAFVYDVIVNKHDGTIHAQSPHVKSAERSGTTVMISLPVHHPRSEMVVEHANFIG